MLALNTQLAYKYHWPSNVSQDSAKGRSSLFAFGRCLQDQDHMGGGNATIAAVLLTHV